MEIRALMESLLNLIGALAVDSQRFGW
jgi:hypothetical protein